MKKIKYIIGFLLIFTSTSFAQGRLVDRIVAEVDNEIITYKQLEKEMLPLVARIESVGYSPERQAELIKELKDKMLQNLIDEKIAEISAAKSGIHVGEKDVNNFLKSVKMEQNFTDEQFENALMQKGFTLKEYKFKMKKQILKKRLIDIEVRSKIIITAEAIKKYYETNTEEYGAKEGFDLSHITFPKGYYPEESKKKVIKAAADLRKLVLKDGFEKTGESIAQHSGGFRVLKGDLGFFNAEDLSGEVIAAVSDLKPGDITNVLETSRGIQFFKINARKMKQSKTLEEATPEIRRALYNIEVEKRFENWISGLKENIHIRIID